MHSILANSTFNRLNWRWNAVEQGFLSFRERKKMRIVDYFSFYFKIEFVLKFSNDVNFLLPFLDVCVCVCLCEDFLESPSMMFENWCYEEEVLTKISSHYRNGEVMPKELQKNLVKSRIANLGFLFRRTNHTSNKNEKISF
jgi:hypothetical protein